MGFMSAEFDFEHARQAEGGPGFSDLSTLIDLSGKPTPLFSAHQTIALKLGSFQEVETVKQQIRGKTILKGQYRFTKELEPWASHIVYVNGQSILTPKLGERTARMLWILS